MTIQTPPPGMMNKNPRHYIFVICRKIATKFSKFEASGWKVVSELVARCSAVD